MSVVTENIDRYRPLLNLMGPLPPEDATLALSIFREIADKGIARLVALSEVTGQPADLITRRLDEAPGVFRDESGDVVGFWGLTAAAVSPHRFIVNGKMRYAWCAWDTLFLPELLQVTAQVESECAQTATPVRLEVSPTEIISASSPDMVVSMLVPEQEAFNRDILASFCHHVHFFVDEQAGRDWANNRSDIELISLQAAFALGQRKNRQQFNH